MGEKTITEKLIDAVENAAIRKAEKIDSLTSSEEVLALAELVRAISICKKVNYSSNSSNC